MSTPNVFLSLKEKRYENIMKKFNIFFPKIPKVGIYKKKQVQFQHEEKYQLVQNAMKYHKIRLFINSRDAEYCISTLAARKITA